MNGRFEATRDRGADGSAYRAEGSTPGSIEALRCRRTARLFSSFLPLLLSSLFPLLTGCDTVEPTESPRLVVEAFFDTGRPLPAVVLRQTHPLDEAAPSDSLFVTDASVVLTLDGKSIAYQHDPQQPGHYRAAPPSSLAAQAQYVLTVRWKQQTFTAAGRMPPLIRIDSVDVRVPDQPVQAILLDSLLADIDSLDLDTGVQQGFVYPVVVTLWWEAAFAETGLDSLYWVHPQLEPRIPVSASLADYFLRTEQLLRERTLVRDARQRRTWTGVYAVPVASDADTLPAHSLRIALLRGGEDYARFAASRDDPERREPVSNIPGGLGIAAGISVDSLRLSVE